MPFIILNHPADIKFQITGKTLEELFKSALLAMNSVLKKEIFKKPKLTKEIIKIKSIDLDALLFDFLSEVLAKSQIKKAIFLPEEIKIDLKNFSLVAKIKKMPIYHFDQDIKAVTYNDLKIKKRKNLWQTKITFDI